MQLAAAGRAHLRCDATVVGHGGQVADAILDELQTAQVAGRLALLSGEMFEPRLAERLMLLEKATR